MKLGTLRNESLDGSPVLVSKDNQSAISIADLAPNLRSAIEKWREIQPALSARYAQLNRGEASGAFPVDQRAFHSPLPRAFSWLDGSAFIQHVKLVRKARNAPLPEGLLTDPLMYQGGSDTMLAPTEDIPMRDFSHGVDFEGEIAVITDHVPMGVSAADALNHILLIVLVNDVSLRGLIPAELKKGFGFLNSKPSSAFSPFALTPDELGDAWQNGRVHLPLDVTYNGAFFGKANGREMHFHFGELIAHAAKTRQLAAGTILGSGTVSNEDTAMGSSCLAEKRMLEKINTGEFKTPFMNAGDTIRIEMSDTDGNNLFGTIAQKVVKVS